MFAVMQAAGLSRNSPRKDWPLPLLKQILTESIKETPRHLLARELWCGSGSASEWWSFQAGYTSSTAAMSMVLPFNKLACFGVCSMVYKHLASCICVRLISIHWDSMSLPLHEGNTDQPKSACSSLSVALDEITCAIHMLGNISRSWSMGPG